ncbi:MAG: hypothetical protein ACE5GK_01055 [Nitrospiria bacterium]
MESKDILKQALNLKPEECFTVVEGLLKSPDEPDKKSMKFGGKRPRKG